MGMNEQMTLEEFFALADRVAGALNVLREARGQPSREFERRNPPEARVTEPQTMLQKLHVAGAAIYGPVATNKGAIEWTPEELARKDALRMRQAATLPTDPVMDALEAE